MRKERENGRKKKKGNNKENEEQMEKLRKEKGENK